MAIDKVLSQEEIDSVFRNLTAGELPTDPARKATPYDFRRPDRIAKDQLRAIHMLHENFARSLGSSLSAYLRAYVVVNLVSVEQLSFAEFSQCLPSPSVILTLGMKPYDGNAVLELNPSLVFPVLEMLLGGGSGRVPPAVVNREVTEIEQSILEGLFRIVLHDLRESWQSVAALAFSIEARETEPQMLRILSPSEAVVAISMEVRIGESAGMMNIGIPSIIIKMLRQKFDQQWALRKSQSTEEEQNRILRLIRPSVITLDARLKGPVLRVEDFLQLEQGDVLTFDYAVDRPLQMEINGKHKYDGYVINTGIKRGFQLGESISLAD